jgi:hypothetical protein
MTTAAFFLILCIGLLAGVLLTYRVMARAGLPHRGRAARELDAMQDSLRDEHTARLTLLDAHAALTGPRGVERLPDNAGRE